MKSMAPVVMKHFKFGVGRLKIKPIIIFLFEFCSFENGRLILDFMS